MRATASARLDAAPDAVFAVIADLTTWPRWLDVVTRATPDGARAWRARFGLKLGPLDVGRDARLVATAYDPPTRLVVERVELDDRDDHSAIELAVDVAPVTTAAGDIACDVTLGALVAKRLPFLDLPAEIERRGPAALRKLERLVNVETRQGH